MIYLQLVILLAVYLSKKRTENLSKTLNTTHCTQAMKNIKSPWISSKDTGKKGYCAQCSYQTPRYFDLFFPNIVYCLWYVLWHLLQLLGLLGYAVFTFTLLKEILSKWNIEIWDWNTATFPGPFTLKVSWNTKWFNTAVVLCFNFLNSGMEFLKVIIEHRSV